MELFDEQPKHVLFIRDVFLNDLWDPKQEFAHTNIHSSSFKKKCTLTNQKFCKFLYFSDIQKWNTISHFCCWNCSLQINDIPRFIPQFIEPSKNECQFIQCEGHFCSFPCAKSYLVQKYTDPHERKLRETMLCYLFFLFFGKHVQSIPLAPNKTELFKFGGKLTEKEYKRKINFLKLNLISQK